MNKRETIKQKFGGLCAYTGTLLKDDWQVDHVFPISTIGVGIDHNHIDNLVPAQRIVNHYKRSLTLEYFRKWYLGGLHDRLKKLPKKTNNPKAIRRKEYLLEIAELFGITEDKPFSGQFYFETLLQ